MPKSMSILSCTYWWKLHDSFQVLKQNSQLIPWAKRTSLPLLEKIYGGKLQMNDKFGIFLTKCIPISILLYMWAKIYFAPLQYYRLLISLPSSSWRSKNWSWRLVYMWFALINPECVRNQKYLNFFLGDFQLVYIKAYSR